MNASLRYGANATVELEIAQHKQVASNHPPRGLDPDELRDAIEAAICEPLGFPPFVEAVVPGDRVAVALEAGVGGAETIVAALVAALGQRGVAVDHVTVVRTQADEDDRRIDPRAALSAAQAALVNVETHNAHERGRLAMLGVSDDDKPIYLSRTLCDADVVVTVGRMRHPSMHDYLGRYGGLLPSFSDSATTDSIRGAVAQSLAPGGKPVRLSQIDQTGRQLGVQFTLQVVPAVDGRPARLLGGSFDSVFDLGGEMYEQLWGFQSPAAASLVLSGITGDEHEQSWDALGRAIAVASSYCDEDGAIVLCSELVSPPGEGVSKLVASEDPLATLRWLRKNAPNDAVAATALTAAIMERRVYLLSRLDEGVVEDLGLIPISNPSEISRLARAHDGCLLLEGAQYMCRSSASQSSSNRPTRRIAGDKG